MDNEYPYCYSAIYEKNEDNIDYQWNIDGVYSWYADESAVFSGEYCILKISTDDKTVKWSLERNDYEGYLGGQGYYKSNESGTAEITESPLRITLKETVGDWEHYIEFNNDSFKSYGVGNLEKEN